MLGQETLERIAYRVAESFRGQRFGRHGLGHDPRGIEGLLVDPASQVAHALGVQEVDEVATQGQQVAIVGARQQDVGQTPLGLTREHQQVLADLRVQPLVELGAHAVDRALQSPTTNRHPRQQRGQAPLGKERIDGVVEALERVEEHVTQRVFDSLLLQHFAHQTLGDDVLAADQLVDGAPCRLRHPLSQQRGVVLHGRERAPRAVARQRHPELTEFLGCQRPHQRLGGRGRVDEVTKALGLHALPGLLQGLAPALPSRLIGEPLQQETGVEPGQSRRLTFLHRRRRQGACEASTRRK